MNTAVCTLFEGHYHFGLAALTNSLFHHGFQGAIYAGFKGELPDWANASKNNNSLNWNGAKTLMLAEGISIHFLPIETEFHLTNYKPMFMLKIWDTLAVEAKYITYLDPDIIVKCNWNFFETWMDYGVALVHESAVNNMTATHPIRKGWEKVIDKAGLRTNRTMAAYVNGGFCGVKCDHKEFIHVWSKVIETAITYFNMTPWQWDHSFDRTYLFCAQDQDALNIAAMTSQSPLSEIGPEGMDFIRGGFTMSHALGANKPWRKNFLLSALKGTSPSLADRQYWQNVSGPLKIYSQLHIYVKRFSIVTAAFIGRFYHRN